jgi:hypothetical protein
MIKCLPPKPINSVCFVSQSGKEKSQRGTEDDCVAKAFERELQKTVKDCIIKLNI